MEFKVISNVVAPEMERILRELHLDGWVVLGFDWSDGGLTGSVLMQRVKSKR